MRLTLPGTCVIGLVLMMMVSCQQQEPISKEQVLLALDSLEHKFEWLDYRIARERWDLYTTGRADSLEFYQELQKP